MRLIVLLLATLLASCNNSEAVELPATPTPTATPTATPAATPTQTPPPISSRSDVFAQAARHVLLLAAKVDEGFSCGSGVLLGHDGLVITNHHVVDNGGSISSAIWAVAHNGTTAELKVIESNPGRDLALLKSVEPLPEPERLVWHATARPAIGTEVLIVGHPLCGTGMKDDEAILTMGIISGYKQRAGQTYIQTDAAMNQGVSGGLAVDNTGAFVGMPVRGRADADNVGFLIPAQDIKNQLRRWVPEVFEPRRTRQTPQPAPQIQTLTPRPTTQPPWTPTPQPTITTQSTHPASPSRVPAVFQQALRTYDEAIRRNPKDPTAFYNRGRTYHQMGRFERAIEDYSESIRLDLQFADAYNNRGLAYAELGQPDQAIRDYDEAIRLDPRSPLTYKNRAIALSMLGKHEEAQKDIDQAVRLGMDRLQLESELKN